MKLDKIKNAYIKNLPNYNYQILTQDGELVANAHLMSNRDKQLLSSYIITTVDENGNTQTSIPDPLGLSAKTILCSIDSWELQLPITAQVIQNLDPDVLAWFASEINKHNFQSVSVVQPNQKN